MPLSLLPEPNWSSREQLQRRETPSPSGTHSMPQGQSQATPTAHYSHSCPQTCLPISQSNPTFSNLAQFSQKKKKKRKFQHFGTHMHSSPKRCLSSGRSRVFDRTCQTRSQDAVPKTKVLIHRHPGRPAPFGFRGRAGSHQKGTARAPREMRPLPQLRCWETYRRSSTGFLPCHPPAPVWLLTH